MKSRQEASIPSRVMYKAKANKNLKMMKYPSDLGAHSLIFDIVRYSYRSREGFVGSEQSSDTIASISLPLPNELPENYNVGYNDSELGYLGQMFMAGGGILSDLESNLSSMGSLGEMGGALSSFGMDVASIGKDSLAYLVFKAVSGLPGGDANGLRKGVALNPALAATLESVPLREHTFNWKFSPRNANEQETLANIHNIIKKNMHPTLGSFSEGSKINGLLQYPMAVDIRLIGKDPKYTMKFKRAFITGFSMNPTDGGHHMHEGTGANAFIDFTLSVKEIQSIVAGDFED